MGMSTAGGVGRNRDSVNWSLGGGKDGSIFISASYFAANRFAELFC